MKTNYTPSMVIDIFKNNYDAGVYYIECGECYKHRSSDECKNATECIELVKELEASNGIWSLAGDFCEVSGYKIFNGYYIPCCEAVYSYYYSGGKVLDGFKYYNIPLCLFGSDYFFTRKEAENALRERKRSKN